MYTCTRCEKVKGESDYNGKSIRLVGNYNATLCDECANEWSAFARELTAFKYQKTLESRLRALESIGQTDLALIEDLFKVDKMLFDFAKEFVEGKEKNDDKPAD